MQIVLPKLEKYQQDVLLTYDKYPKNHTVTVVSPRQVGKSITLVCLLIYASYKQSKSISISVAPIAAQARKNYNDLCNIAAPLIHSKNSSLLEVTFLNNSKVQFRSAESGDNLRGITVKGSGLLLIDEAAYIKDSLYYEVLVPMTNVFNGSIFLFSTPRTKSGIFWDNFEKGEQGQTGYITINWTDYDLSRFLPNSLLDKYRMIMPKKAFENEYLAIFTDGEGSVFSYFNNSISPEPVNIDYSLPITISVDWAVGLGQDYTVISFLQSYAGKIILIKQIEFNDKTANQTIDTIIDICKDLTNNGIPEINLINERNGIGNVFNQILLDRLDDLQGNNTRYLQTDINTSLFTTTNKSKDKIVKEFNVLVENNKLVLPNDKSLSAQLSAFECKINANGLVTYSAPIGQHDDRVMSLLIGIDKLYTDLTNE